MDLWALVAVPLGLGLLGFIEPCSLGSTLLFVKFLEGKGRWAKIRETAVFTVVRAGFVGTLGALAGLLGSMFLDLQRGFWVVLGVVYLALGAVYLLGRQGLLKRTVGPRIRALGDDRGAAALGAVFGLNIPACAAPLLAGLLAAGVGAGDLAEGFLALAVFGLGLSLPLVAAVFWEQARAAIDRLGGLTRRIPGWTGAVLVAVGAWSIWFGLSYRATGG